MTAEGEGEDMNYLYGDSTPSQLKSNFLEFLRDALEFCVFVLQADTRIKQGKADIRSLSEKADVESARLDRFIKSVSVAVEQGEKGDPDSPTSRCGQRIYSLIADTYRSSLEGIRQSLSDAIAKIDADEVATRDACLAALGTLLAPHDPPNAVDVMQLTLGDSGHYQASVEGKSEPSLAWTLGAEIPDANAFAEPLRLDRIAPHLEIRAPQLAGWITKEVKTRPQKLERHIVMKVVDDHATLSFEVRLETSLDAGFDFAVDIEEKTVKSKRVGPAEDQSVGAFELQGEDIGAVVDLATKLRAELSAVQRQPNISATVDGSDFRALPNFVEFVERLVAMMAPIVREISQRSLTPTELVLRRPLGNDRREEIFVAKSTLREKLAVLPPELRWLFTPLGLEVGGAPPERPAPPADPPAIRSELPPTGSVPPPAIPPAAALPKNLGPPAPAIRSNPPMPPGSAPNAPPVSPFSVRSGSPKSAPQAQLQSAPQNAPQPQPQPQSAPQRRSPSDAQIEIGEEIELSADDVIPDSERNLVDKPPPGEKRNEALVTALKKIMTLSKNGRSAEAYQEYAALFSSTAFADYRIEDQRQALRLLVLAKSHPADTEAVAAAHRAALRRLEALVGQAHEPADQELLGVTHLVLGDEKAASAAFQQGLDAERARNPQSDLIASLMRRASAL